MRPMAPKESIQSNIPEFSVSELAFSLKKTLEENYGRIRVRGELSRVKIHASGHMYTDLKDADSVLNAVCWKGTVSKLSVRPEEGLEVICAGRISTYPARSNYQLIIESMELAGEGALLKMLEDRRKKLAAEGLFDPARKRPIPFLPEVIGVITSPTGSVIRDILHRLADRYPRHVLVWPVAVQGAGAAEQVAEAIERFNALPSTLPRPDLLIVARGGGSLEDLMPFNEEIVVRAAANSKIPLISAIGHETDTTLIDLAADLRAPTPTGAAEMAVPRRADLLAQTLDNQQRLIHGLTRLLSESSHRLEARARALADPRRMLEAKTQGLDHARDKMERIYGAYLSLKSADLMRSAARLRHPSEILERTRKELLRWSGLLEAYSFENTLKRGFVVALGADGHVVTEPSTLQAGQDIHLRFKENRTVNVTVNGQKREIKKAARSPDASQSSLF